MTRMPRHRIRRQSRKGGQPSRPDEGRAIDLISRGRGDLRRYLAGRRGLHRERLHVQDEVVCAAFTLASCPRTRACLVSEGTTVATSVGATCTVMAVRFTMLDAARLKSRPAGRSSRG